jgi:1,4-dihydroxy-2-naphthoyl-CoA hydrolase
VLAQALLRCRLRLVQILDAGFVKLQFLNHSVYKEKDPYCILAYMGLPKKKLKKIRLRDTDATGVLYFTEQLRMALETLEDCFSLRSLLEKEAFLMPIVHAEADYFAPLRVGDEVEITLSCEKLGTTSFTLGYRFYDPKRQKEVGKASIVHVVISKETGKSIPVPSHLQALLRQSQNSSP